MTTEVTTRDPFSVMDRMDDKLIEEELQNRVANTWAYAFTGSDGRSQEGLSKVGVDEACAEMSKRGFIIRESGIKYEKDPIDPEYILFQCAASLVRITGDGEEVLLDVVNGTKRQWSKFKKRDGTVLPDPFWFEKGAMKAARNARSRLIPADTKTRILTLAREKRKTKNVDEQPKTKSQGKSESANSDSNKEKSITEPQRKKLWAMMKEKELSSDEAKQMFDWLGIETTKQASDIIKKFETKYSEWKGEGYTPPPMIECPEHNGREINSENCENCTLRPDCPAWD